MIAPGNFTKGAGGGPSFLPFAIRSKGADDDGEPGGGGGGGEFDFSVCERSASARSALLLWFSNGD